MSRENKTWAVTFAIWAMGAAIIWALWDARVFVSDFVEDTFEFVLYVIAFFYFLALGPIRDFVEAQVFGPPSGDESQ